MNIVFIEINNYRGIQSMSWAPRPGINCLIGPGDSTKTTILDAIELALNPRSYAFASDSDFYNLKTEDDVSITVTLAGLPADFKAENKYGLYLRGWSAVHSTLHDEPAKELEDALSIRVVIDSSLETHWSIFNDRVGRSDVDAPTIRYRDIGRFATSRLGPYAERHLGWGRYSALSQMESSKEEVHLRLANAGRAARKAFKLSGEEVFRETVAKAEELSKGFSVPIKEKYRADLDIQSVSVSTGGIALHDGNLPLRLLGTGSARLLVSALQQQAANSSHVALIDEIEHGLEPHRISRLLKYLESITAKVEGTKDTQIFLTTHSPVVIRELNAKNIFTVRSTNGVTTVTSVDPISQGSQTQNHLRSCPEAFLARKILIGEGRTECGLLRGIDVWWTSNGNPSFGFRGVVAIHGDGKDRSPQTANTLLTLGYAASLLLDSDQPPNPDAIRHVREKGGKIIQWEGNCSTEERIFLDLPWDGVAQLLGLAKTFAGDDSIETQVRDACDKKGMHRITITNLPSSLDRQDIRQTLGYAAKKSRWFKDISRAEDMAAIVCSYLSAISRTPLAKTIAEIRRWVDDN